VFSLNLHILQNAFKLSLEISILSAQLHVNLCLREVLLFFAFYYLAAFAELVLNATSVKKSPSVAWTARFETSEVTEFAFSGPAPGWVTSVAAATAREKLSAAERKQERAQQTERTTVKKINFCLQRCRRRAVTEQKGGFPFLQSACVTAERERGRKRVRECVAVKQRLSFT